MRQKIKESLVNGVPFALCQNGATCCFRNGLVVGYVELWSALEELKGTDTVRSKKLEDIYPDLFEGASDCSFVKKRQ